jgi:hypothetical protein
MPTCFVIQPFDSGKFDKRFKETFAPAIVAAGFEPYGYFCPTHRKGKIGALPEFRAHQLCLQRLSNIAVTGGNLLPGTVGSCRLDAVY